MNPKNFLIFGGIVLVLVGLLGMMGPIGPTAADSIFGSSWWFDPVENWAHLILGIVGLIAAFILPASLQRTLVILLGIVALLVAVYNVFSTELGGANLQNPADLVLHLVVAIWAFASSLGKKTGTMAAPTV